MSQSVKSTWVAAVLLVSGAGCASTIPQTVFQPQETASVRSFFRNGHAIGAVYGDSVFALAQVEPLDIAGRGYARLWLLVENHSSGPMLVEPLKCVTLRVESIRRQKVVSDEMSGNPNHRADLTPVTPTRILASISNAQATASIFAGVGAVLEAAAAQPTTAKTTSVNSATGERYESQTTINDVDQKRRAILSRRASGIASTDAWYESFKNSVNAGILRRNTLFPGEGVNGYIYFRASTMFPPGRDRRYIVSVSMPAGEQVVTFDPIDGE